jgi:hypothetical protein
VSDERPGRRGAGGRRGWRHARGLREQIAVTDSSAAGAYGYTISFGGAIAIAIAIGELGAPALGEALLLMAGAVIAFLTLELVASRGALRIYRPPPDRPSPAFGNAHFVSAGVAICAAWLTVQLVGAPAAWAVMGFAVTAMNFLITATQRILVARWQERHTPRGRSAEPRAPGPPRPGRA